MTAPSAEALDRSDALAWQDSFAAAPAEYRDRSGMSTTVTAAGYGRAFRAAPRSLFNRFLLAPEERFQSAAAVSAAAEWLALQAASVHAVETSAPVGSMAHRHITGAGFRLSSETAKFWREALPLPLNRPTSLEIREIGADRGNDFASVTCRGFGMSDALMPWISAIPGRPGWRIYLAYADGVPVAAGGMHVQGDIAWLGWGATLPEYRSQGGQGALLARRLQDGINAGVGLFNIETGNVGKDGHPGASYRNIERIGFKLSHVRHVFERPAG